MHKKAWLAIFFCLYLFIFSAVTLPTAVVGIENAAPGSREDPLVTKSYVDGYLNQRIAPLEAAVQRLSEQAAQLEQRVNALKAQHKPRVILTLNSLEAYTGERRHTLEAAPFLLEGRTMVPFRFVGEAFGAKVDWNEADRTVLVEHGNSTLAIPIGKKTLTHNGQPLESDVAAVLVNGRTFVPIRIISETLGAAVDWHEATREIHITLE